ncbi:LRR domain containing protein [Parasponia andersonii]|uniref:LRR domain containing protein n=1 Tax=Parasponia andersonii TaxID=3476 RepID=A0A2P5DPG8_PARAD|nr:LRR domain containing protein [Parasponia andersonii]
MAPIYRKSLSASNKLSNLKHLDVMGCKKLLFLPERPVSLQYLDASGCTSLKTISTGMKALAKGFWDDFDIT